MPDFLNGRGLPFHFISHLRPDQSCRVTMGVGEGSSEMLGVCRAAHGISQVPAAPRQLHSVAELPELNLSNELC